MSDVEMKQHIELNGAALRPISSGLEGVVVADTALSEVDGERGRLLVRGEDVEALAERRGFEAAALLLWTGAEGDAVALSRALGAARMRAHEWLMGTGRGALEADDVMRALAGAVALRGGAGMGGAGGAGGARTAAIELAALVGVAAAAWGARAAGAEPWVPDPARGHAADLLRLIARREVSESEAKALEAYLVTVMDHGMNASTFTARVVASTAASDDAAIAAAIGALSGPLHGGAPGPVLDMLDAVACDGDARRWLRGELEAGRRIMGMGHRVYRVRDPRVVVLERAAEALRASGHGSPRLAIAREVERAAESLLAERYPARALKANVELATAVLLDAVGVPRALFTALFACGRVVGWLAHVDEQRASGRLIRPESRYIGPRAGA